MPAKDRKSAFQWPPVPRDANELLKVLTDASQDIDARTEAAHLLPIFGREDKRTIGALVGILANADENSTLRTASASALCSLICAAPATGTRASETSPAQYLSQPATETFVRIATDQNDHKLTRAQVVAILPCLSDDRVADALVALLSNRDDAPEVRAQAASALASYSNEAIVSLLLNVLASDKDARIRANAAGALGKNSRSIADGRLALEPLITALSDPSDDVAAQAARALGKLRNIQAVEFLIYALGHKHWSVQQEAIEALRLFRDKRAVEPLISFVLADDSYGQAPRMAIWCLADLQDQHAVEPLMTIVADSTRDIYARAVAARALGELKSNSAVELLIDVLSNRENDLAIRDSALDSLGEIGDLRALKPLVGALGESSLALGAAGRLKDAGLLTDDRIIEPLRELAADSTMPGPVLATALGQFAQRGAGEQPSGLLVQVCQDVLDDTAGLERGSGENQSLRHVAIITIGLLANEHDERALQPLIGALQHKDDTVRYVAAISLGNLGDRNAVAALINALNDPVNYVFYSCAEALGKLGDSSALEALWAMRENARNDALGDIVRRVTTSAIAAIQRSE